MHAPLSDVPWVRGFNDSQAVTNQSFFHRTQDAYERFAKELRYFVLNRTQNLGETEEIVQETFLRFHALAKRTDIQQPRGFLYRIATNLSADYHRRNARHGVNGGTTSPEDGTSDDSFAPLEIDRLEKREDLDAVMKAIEKLPKRAKQVFLLRRIEGLSYREISQRLGISEKTVGKHLGKAVQRVTEAYEIHAATGLEDGR